jgi:hypothetical protein
MSMMTEPALEVDVLWIEHFVVVDGSEPTRVAFARIKKHPADWVVISRNGGEYLYVFRKDELLHWMPLPPGALVSHGSVVPFEIELGLREELQSTKTTHRGSQPPIDRSWRSEARAPSIDRWVEVDEAGEPKAIGIPDISMRGLVLDLVLDDLEASPEPAGAAPAPAPSAPPVASPLPTGPLSIEDTGAFPVIDEGPPEEPEGDEGTRPVRFPSIEPDRPIVAGQRITIKVDLLRRATSHTEGGPIDTGALPKDWKTLDLSVMLSSAAIDLDDEEPRRITIARNAASTPATFSGTVHRDVPAGAQIEITAAFFHGCRFCGSARRELVAGEVPEADTGKPGSAGIGAVAVDIGAEQPHVTVFIERLDKSRPGLLRWRVEPCERFDGLPSTLREDVDLGQDPAAVAGALFKRFATLVPGQHRPSIEGFGDELWNLAPRTFHDAYWALYARYGGRLRIQFVCDEPHLPWELMRPSSEDERTIHPPLALEHSVARWIDRYSGDMRNSLPGGSLVSIAPKYSSARLSLRMAQEEHERIVERLGAKSVRGTREALFALLEDEDPMPPVGVLHFAGHGQFAADVAAASSIKLENGETLLASEVKRREVRLGRVCRTLVFFNACEVGATGSVFGEVGGWADAFLDRKFGGFIAPLWAVEEADSAKVAAELLDGIYARRAPIGETLRSIRAKYADKSPTYFSYLYYGDVTARLAR